MTSDKYLNEAINLAKSSIYDDAKYLGTWKGYAVYQPTFADDKPRFIGFPQFILADSNSIRFTNDDEESRAIMNKFW